MASEVHKDRDASPEDQGKSELVLYFNHPVEEKDRLLIEGLIYALYDRDRTIVIEDGEVESSLKITGNQFKLNRLAKAFNEKEWESNQELLKKLSGYLEGRKGL